MLWNLFKKSCQNEKLHCISALIYQPQELDQGKKERKRRGKKIILSLRRIKKTEQGKKKWYKMDNSLARNSFSK